MSAPLASRIASPYVLYSIFQLKNIMHQITADFRIFLDET
jgi:hypothetical protein